MSAGGDHCLDAALDAREQAAVARLVERVAHGCDAASTWYDLPSAPGDSPPVHADVVVTCGWDDGGRASADRCARVSELASRAAKMLVVVLVNAERVRLGGRGRGQGALDLARLLWELGRVREHAYLVFPRAVEVIAAAEGRVVAPDVAQAPVGTLVRRTAHLHAFVVDTTPRTRQARRRLRIAGASGEPG